MDRIRPANRPRSRFAEADVTNLSLLDEPDHRLDGIFYRHLRIDAVQIIEIDVVRLKAPQRRLAGDGHILRPPIGQAALRSWLASEIAEFRRQHDGVSFSL